MKAYERTHDNENVSIVISSDASMTELIAGRDFFQAEIDGRTPKLEEPGAVTVQSGPVQVVENEPGWSEWFEWSGGENPVGPCVIQKLSALLYNWDYTTLYRVKLSSIPQGYSLMDGVLFEDLPKGGE